MIVNDRADIARLSSADGVHVGQDDSVGDARAVVGADAIVGVSTHTTRSWNERNEPVSYVAIGPVYTTTTKAPATTRRRWTLREAAGHTRAAGVPLVAIGGITLENAASVLAAGAARWRSSAICFRPATPRHGPGRLSNASRVPSGPAYNRRVFTAHVIRNERGT